MVRLARGAMMPNRGRGRGRPPPMLNQREHLMGLRSQHDIHPGFGPPLPPPPPRGPMGLPRRMPPAPLPPPPPPMPPRPPLHMRPGFPLPPRPPLGRRPFPPGPPHPGILPPPMRPLHPPPPPPPPLVRARGGLMRRPGLRPGMGLKRLGPAANGRIKRIQKRKPKLKEKSEEAELNKPWVTEALRKEIIKKHKLYQTAREKKQDSDWQAFKEQRNLVAKMTNTVKLEYIGSHPDAGEFYCDTCDRGWKMHEELIKHQSEHETCGRDGCTFQAHPKVVQKHIELQHFTGLYKRITFSYDPEEIQRWIAERKRRFPTAENVEKKHQQREEMMKRGERIGSEKGFHRNGKEMRQRGGHYRYKRGGRSHTSRHHGHRKPRHEKIEQKPVCSSAKEYDPDSWRGKLPMFPGTDAFPEIELEVTDEAVDLNFSDDEWEKDATCNQESVKPAFVSSALSALMGNYGSDISGIEDNEEPEPTYDQKLFNTVSSKTYSNINQKPNDNQVNADNQPEVAGTGMNTESTVELPPVINSEVNDKAETDDDSGPEEVKIQREPPIIGNVENKQPDSDKHKTGNSNDVSHSKNNRQSNLKKRVPTVKRPIQHPMYRRKRLTLLEKLLRNEIQHERNVILQCLRYVVENNFFGLASSENEVDIPDDTIKSEGINS